VLLRTAPERCWSQSSLPARKPGQRGPCWRGGHCSPSETLRHKLLVQVQMLCQSEQKQKVKQAGFLHTSPVRDVPLCTHTHSLHGDKPKALGTPGPQIKAHIFCQLWAPKQRHASLIRARLSLQIPWGLGDYGNSVRMSPVVHPAETNGDMAIVVTLECLSLSGGRAVPQTSPGIFSRQLFSFLF
jgi:hypothetical protein